MSVFGLRFDDSPARAVAPPERGDVPLFVGFVALRAGAELGDLPAWWREQGWARHGDGRGGARGVEDGLPVPVSSWAAFDAVFAWDERPVSGGGSTATWLGLAVRAFLRMGGRRCLIARAGAPWPLGAPDEPAIWQERRASLLGALARAGDRPSPRDRASWRGVGALLGCPEASLLCLPDLAEISTGFVETAENAPVTAATGEQWVTCSEPAQAAPPSVDARAPRCDLAGLARWSADVAALAGWLAEQRRDATLVAALPLLRQELPHARDPLAALLAGGHLAPRASGGLASGFVQLGWPWLGAADGPEGLMSPEGALAGLIAAAAWRAGPWRSAAGPVPGIDRLYPEPDRAALFTPRDAPGAPPALALQPLVRRVSVFGRGPAGVQLLGDHSMAPEDPWRHAAVGRLVGWLVRRLQEIGDNLVFQSNDAETWAHARHVVGGLLDGLHRVGALDGSPAWEVRCGPETTRPADRDAGRLVVELWIRPVMAIEAISVRLSRSEAGESEVQVTLPGEAA